MSRQHASSLAPTSTAASERHLRMAAVDAELETRLAEQTQNGLLDIKCHIEVSRHTRPEDFRRALLNVFEREEHNGLRSVPAREVRSFDQLVSFVLG